MPPAPGAPRQAPCRTAALAAGTPHTPHTPHHRLLPYPAAEHRSRLAGVDGRVLRRGSVPPSRDTLTLLLGFSFFNLPLLPCKPPGAPGRSSSWWLVIPIPWAARSAPAPSVWVAGWWQWSPLSFLSAPHQSLWSPPGSPAASTEAFCPMHCSVAWMCIPSPATPLLLSIPAPSLQFLGYSGAPEVLSQAEDTQTGKDKSSTLAQEAQSR